MRPRVAYLLSLFVFGTAGLVRGVADYLSSDGLWSVVGMLAGGAMVAIVAYNAARPESYDGPEEWGPLVYLTVCASLLFTAGALWDLL